MLCKSIKTLKGTTRRHGITGIIGIIGIIVLTDLYFLHFNPGFCLLLCKLISGQVMESLENLESLESLREPFAFYIELLWQFYL
jgi:hypothetical protein